MILLEHHTQAKREIVARFQQLADVAEGVGMITLARDIRTTRVPKLEAERFHLVVLGEFNHGKSTFVNALLGQDVLPTGITPTTASINHVVYGDTPRAHVTLNGSWTLQLKNEGNYEGEEPAEPASPSVIGNYPEALSEARHYPTGRLQTFQRHRARVWGIYDHSFGKAGDLTASGLWRFESGRPYSLTTRQLLTGIQQDLLEDYVDQPEDQQVFYSERGFETFGRPPLASMSRSTPTSACFGGAATCFPQHSAISGKCGSTAFLNGTFVTSSYGPPATCIPIVTILTLG
jgi:hypothetical protein